MSSEPSLPPDLAAIDLSISFAPAWAKEADSAQRFSKLAEKHGGGEERPERGGKGRGDWNDRGPRKDRRPPRSDGGARAGGGKRDSGRPERGASRRPEREPRPAPAPTLSGWEIRFLPDRHGVDGLAKQIKGSAKAYPLFDLARLVLEKSERYLVEFRRAAEDATALFQLKADGSLWLSESEALAHALKTQIDKFYRRDRIAVDPPKGAYPFVAVCGMSGTLLGPPNYHDYQSKIRQLHAERFASMPFEAFKNRIRMERDEDLINKWREEQGAKDVFYPIKEPAKLASDEPKPEVPAEETSVEPSPTPEIAAENVEPEQPAAEEITTVDEPPSDPIAEAPETVTPEIAAEPIAAGEKLESLADVERHFREHHAGKAVVKIRDRVVVPGPAALNESAAAVLDFTRGLWEELDRFPLPLAHNLGQQLTGKGLQIFKTPDNITCVGVARPRHLDVAVTPVSEGLSGILEYLSSHASTPRTEQLRDLVALRFSEADPEAAVMRDLSWLLHEGHVIDYAKRGLEVAARPKSPQIRPPKKTTPSSAASEEQSTSEPAAFVEPEIATAPEESDAPEPNPVEPGA